MLAASLKNGLSHVGPPSSYSVRGRKLFAQLPTPSVSGIRPARFPYVTQRYSIKVATRARTSSITSVGTASMKCARRAFQSTVRT